MKRFTRTYIRSAKTFLSFKAIVVIIQRTLQDLNFLLTICIPGVVFVADATTMYRCYANNPSILVFSSTIFFI